MSMEAVSDEVWTLRCVEQLIVLDPQLDPALAEPVAADLCSRARWRSMTPEAAARAVFDYRAKR